MFYNFEGGIAHLHIVTFFVSKQKMKSNLFLEMFFPPKFLSNNVAQ